MPLYHVQTFYFFVDLNTEHLSSIRAWLLGQAKQYNVLGLIILGSEGLNTTIASQDQDQLHVFVERVKTFLSAPNFQIKESQSDKAPFRRFVVKIRQEIVTLGRPDFVPKGEHRHLPPEQWHQMIQRDDVVVIDTRNDYEVEIGTFNKALDLKIKEFREFPEKIKQLDTDKEKPHLIFCTGGIRCEKAIFEMEQQGFKNVYQLEGGIISYMEKFPKGEFQGECFVFDSRVAVNDQLQPSSRYSLCPQCGEVASQEIVCRKCDASAQLCKSCHTKIQEEPQYETCSKNCRYHYSRDPHKKGPQQKQFYHQDG
jgi:UPF0176 protein